MTDREITIEIIQQPDIVIELNEQGPQGPAGPIGPQGNAGTIDIGTVFTQPYGSDMRVVNRGTSQSAVLDFYLTEGPQGIQGLVGEAGGTYPEYNASTSTLDFYTWNDEGDLLPPQAIHYLSELENDVGYITSSALEPINAELEDCVKNTDYATSSKGGVIVSSGSYGAVVSQSTGYLYTPTKTLAQYNSMATSSFIGKGTLENIKDDYVKRGVTENQTELSAEEQANAKQWLGYATQTDIMQAIASIPQFKLSIVASLPATGEKMTLYLVPKEGTNNDVYDEYIWIEQTSSFEHLGTTAVDLTDYVRNTDYASNTGGVVKLASTSFGVTQYNGYLQGYTATLERYNEVGNPFIVCKGTLENVLTQYATKEELGDIGAILDNINGEVV